MPVITVLHNLRVLMSDVKTEDNLSTLFDDDYYAVFLKSKGINPFAPANSQTPAVYLQLQLALWYIVAGNMSLVRKLEEIGSTSDEFNVGAHIRMLEFQLSAFRESVYGYPSIS